MSENNLKELLANQTFYNIVRVLRKGPLLEATIVKYLSTAFKQNNRISALKITEKLEKDKIISSFKFKEDKYYVLIKDFYIIRVPPKETIDYVQKKSDIPTSLREKYLMIVKRFFKNYVISSEEAKSDAELLLIEIIINLELLGLINFLNKKPIPLEEFQKKCSDIEKVKDILLKHNIIEILSESDEKKGNWVFLKSNLQFQFFFPEYLIKTITEQLNDKKFNKEIAIKSLYTLKTKYLEYEKPEQFKEINKRIKNKLEIITSLEKKGEKPIEKAKELKKLYKLVGDYDHIELWRKKLFEWQQSLK